MNNLNNSEPETPEKPFSDDAFAEIYKYIDPSGKKPFNVRIRERGNLCYYTVASGNFDTPDECVEFAKGLGVNHYVVSNETAYFEWAGESYPNSENIKRAHKDNIKRAQVCRSTYGTL